MTLWTDYDPTPILTEHRTERLDCGTSYEAEAGERRTERDNRAIAVTLLAAAVCVMILACGCVRL